MSLRPAAAEHLTAPILLLLVFSLTNCSKNPVSISRSEDMAQPPSGSFAAAPLRSGHGGWSSFYPLAIGNRWTYSQTIEYREIFDDPSIPPRFLSFHQTMERQIVGSTVLSGVTWMEERVTIHGELDPGNTVFSTFLRQDESGLYQMFDGESTVYRYLAYPLHPGEEWLLADDPPFLAGASKFEVLDLPAGRCSGWRINLGYGTAEGPGEYRDSWYGRSGLIQTALHFDRRLSNKRVIYDDVVELTGIFLAANP